MSDNSMLHDLLAAISEAESLDERTRLIEYLERVLDAGKIHLESLDRDTLATFVMSEMSTLAPLLEEAETYREKDGLIHYAHSLLNLVVMCYGTPGDIPDVYMADIRGLGEAIDREQFVENAVNEAFSNGVPAVADIDRILCVVSPLKDEYRKGKLYQGILHFRSTAERLPADAKARLASYAAAELERYLALESFDADVHDALELLCDAAAVFMSEELVAPLMAAMARGDNAIKYYAAATLLGAGKPVSDDAIATLAADMEYASLCYAALSDAGQASRFPAALATPEYLAESDMVHWLLYPTELGRAPDAIEHLGVVKKHFGKEIYHIFRFKSDSDNLSEELKGQWLVGWSGGDGGTFSNFDRYDELDQGTPEKTLKYIKRKLL